MANKLAIKGGKPILKKPLPIFPASPIGPEEKKAVKRVLHSGKLSEFVAHAGDYFLGGPEVKNFEKSFCEKFNVKYAVSFNSATTALQAAVAALKIGPGDEVIVSPYTMSASASCILMNGAVPIFADINEDNFCLDPESIRQKITPRTKAIIVVNIFGGPADFAIIKAIAQEHNLKIIEDNAQAPGALYQGQLTGTIGDIGIFSFNLHKVIQCGEGGVLVTNDQNYALRAQLVRNHGEVVTDQMPELEDKVILGSNYRLTELQAAVASEQLLKLDRLNQERLELVEYLTDQLKTFPGIKTPVIKEGVKHVFYVYPLKIKEEVLGISRDNFVAAMAAEGFPMSKGYVKPIYLLPIYQLKKVFNETHFPFESNYYDGVADYQKGLCPVCERMYEKEFTFTTICQYPYTKKQIDLFIKAIAKIIKNKKELS